MTDRTIERAELLAIYDGLCDLWQRAVWLDQNSLAYILWLSLQEAHDKLGADLPMPAPGEAPSSAQEPGQVVGPKEAA